MESEKIVPTERELRNFELTNPDTLTLIQQAQAADEEDRKLTIPQAAKKYKKAVFWSCLLSTALIMEGYDVVIVRIFPTGRARQNADCFLDQLFLWSEPVPGALWNFQREDWKETDHSTMAVWPGEFCTRR
jgi:hypothetical protein